MIPAPGIVGRVRKNLSFPWVRLLPGFPARKFHFFITDIDVHIFIFRDGEDEPAIQQIYAIFPGQESSLCGQLTRSRMLFKFCRKR
jgi:hypothetical protein